MLKEQPHLKDKVQRISCNVATREHLERTLPMKHYIAISMTIFTVARIARNAAMSQHSATKWIRNCVHRHDIPVSNEQVRRLIRTAYN
jgi:hypothetical protein